MDDASLNRIETYDDEAEVLEATMEALRAAGRDDGADAMSDVRDLVTALRVADERLAGGEGAVTVGSANAAGASTHVDGIGNEGE